MTKEYLISRLDRVEKMAMSSKLFRFFSSPLNYIFAIIHRVVVYPLTKKEIESKSKTFFDYEMHLLLPSSTDIFLTKGKSHMSEIRLARYMIHNLGESDCFVDVGAHYGYFSLLASRLVNVEGKVASFEASPKTFKILSKNVKNLTNIEANNIAISDSEEGIEFYEFPNLYSEYNTINPSQFSNEVWVEKYRPAKVKVGSTSLGNYLENHSLIPTMIKIDVEGAEDRVIFGLKKYLEVQQPIIIMEYLRSDRGNESHKTAYHELIALGYKCYYITESGKLVHLENPDNHFHSKSIDSDNLVFKKS